MRAENPTEPNPPATMVLTTLSAHNDLLDHVRDIRTAIREAFRVPPELLADRRQSTLRET